MKPTDKKWKDRSTKEKLDFVFVIVAILGFSLGAISSEILDNKFS